MQPKCYTGDLEGKHTYVPHELDRLNQKLYKQDACLTYFLGKQKTRQKHKRLFKLTDYIILNVDGKTIFGESSNSGALGKAKSAAFVFNIAMTAVDTLSKSLLKKPDSFDRAIQGVLDQEYATITEIFSTGKPEAHPKIFGRVWKLVSERLADKRIPQSYKDKLQKSFVETLSTFANEKDENHDAAVEIIAEKDAKSADMLKRQQQARQALGEEANVLKAKLAKAEEAANDADEQAAQNMMVLEEVQDTIKNIDEKLTNFMDALEEANEMKEADLEAFANYIIEKTTNISLDGLSYNDEVMKLSESYAELVKSGASDEVLAEKRELLKKAVDDDRATHARIENSLQQLELASALFSNLGQLMGFPPEALNRFTSLTGGAIAISRGISAIVSGSSTALTALGGPLGVGVAITSGALQILGAFRNSGPSAEQVLLMNVNKLSKQIDDVARHLDKRFDRVEKMLEQVDNRLDFIGDISVKIYETMHQRFDDITKQVGEFRLETLSHFRELHLGTETLTNLVTDVNSKLQELDKQFDKKFIEQRQDHFRDTQYFAFTHYRNVDNPIRTPLSSEKSLEYLQTFNKWLERDVKDSRVTGDYDAVFSEKDISEKVDSDNLFTKLNMLNRLASAAYDGVSYGSQINPALWYEGIYTLIKFITMTPAVEPNDDLRALYESFITDAENFLDSIKKMKTSSKLFSELTKNIQDSIIAYVETSHLLIQQGAKSNNVAAHLEHIRETSSQFFREYKTAQESLANKEYGSGADAISYNSLISSGLTRDDFVIKATPGNNYLNLLVPPGNNDPDCESLASERGNGFTTKYFNRGAIIEYHSMPIINTRAIDSENHSGFLDMLNYLHSETGKVPPEATLSCRNILNEDAYLKITDEGMVYLATNYHDPVVHILDLLDRVRISDNGEFSQQPALRNFETNPPSMQLIPNRYENISRTDISGMAEIATSTIENILRNCTSEISNKLTELKDENSEFNTIWNGYIDKLTKIEQRCKLTDKQKNMIQFTKSAKGEFISFAEQQIQKRDAIITNFEHAKLIRLIKKFESLAQQPEYPLAGLIRWLDDVALDNERFDDMDKLRVSLNDINGLLGIVGRYQISVKLLKLYLQYAFGDELALDSPSVNFLNNIWDPEKLSKEVKEYNIFQPNTTVFSDMKDIVPLVGSSNQTLLPNRNDTFYSDYLMDRIAEGKALLESQDDNVTLGHGYYFMSYAIEDFREFINTFLPRNRELNAGRVTADEIYQNARLRVPDYFEKISQYALTIDKTNRLGDTALIIAARECDKVTAKWLIENEADVNAKNSDGNSPLDFAFLCGERGHDVLEKLFDAGATETRFAQEIAEHFMQSLPDHANLTAFCESNRLGMDCLHPETTTSIESTSTIKTDLSMTSQTMTQASEDSTSLMPAPPMVSAGSRRASLPISLPSLNENLLFFYTVARKSAQWVSTWAPDNQLRELSDSDKQVYRSAVKIYKQYRQQLTEVESHYSANTANANLMQQMTTCRRSVNDLGDLLREIKKEQLISNNQSAELQKLVNEAGKYLTMTQKLQASTTRHMRNAQQGYRVGMRLFDLSNTMAPQAEQTNSTVMLNKLSKQSMRVLPN